MNSPAPTGLPQPRIIPRSDHSVSRAQISPNALRVLYRLREGGYQAFLVGGCVRDLLLGITPKDFDVATDALPEEVRKLFRNCRLVGRRFRLAHVFFGRETIEVATFRAATAPSQGEEPAELESEDAEELGEASADLATDLAEDPEEDLIEDSVDEGFGPEHEAEQHIAEGEEEADAAPAPASRPWSAADVPESDTHRAFDETGRILRDNVYGSIDEDVWRRDFTANSLYYNIADFSLWDYVDGAQDIAARTLRLIGDPETRYREDPVRMLRAARFEAKLGFQLDPATAEPIGRLAELLGGVPPARLFDETLKLFLTGHGESSYAVLRRRGLLGALLPTVVAYLDEHPGSLVEQLLLQGLRNTDQRVLADKPVTPTFLFALLLYGPIAGIIEAMPPQQWHEAGAILDACDQAVRRAQVRISIPRRFSLGLREMFALQPRLEHPRGRRALRSLEHPRFRAAYDLLLLRSQLGMAAPEMVQWWTRLQEVGATERERMADALGGGGPPRREGARRGPRRRRRPANPA
ncbi:MAG TPA: polynucleotide adenylyltransferase PcnB [Steroidobacteraceae bacterium]|nr:polynucleotide adenylyltransferase PcnB [Steroidobacteraceae bacterium]